MAEICHEDCGKRWHFRSLRCWRCVLHLGTDWQHRLAVMAAVDSRCWKCWKHRVLPGSEAPVPFSPHLASQPSPRTARLLEEVHTICVLTDLSTAWHDGKVPGRRFCHESSFQLWFEDLLYKRAAAPCRRPLWYFTCRYDLLYSRCSRFPNLLLNMCLDWPCRRVLYAVAACICVNDD